jgi:transcriptional regulator with PAS, ATPase and Fis domain
MLDSNGILVVNYAHKHNSYAFWKARATIIMDETTNHLPVNTDLYDRLFEGSEDAIVVCRKRKPYKIEKANRAARALFALPDRASDSLLADLIGTDGCARVFAESGGVCRTDYGDFDVQATAAEGHLYIVLHNLSCDTKNESQSVDIKNLYTALQAIYQQYADETIMIVDANSGMVEYAGVDNARHCGMAVSDLVGKSIFDLEREKVFYPVVSTRVMESGETEALIQKTRTGLTLVTVGSPIFDDKGELKKIISVTRDYQTHMHIGELISRINMYDRRELPDKEHYEGVEIVTCDEAMLRAVALAHLVSDIMTTVLITGETGTGKEVIARYIHKTGNRSAGPFVKVNCGAISPTIIESELFGYEPGAFTGASHDGKTGLIESANGGTLFLDEISELPLEQQAKLLHVLQDRTLTRVGGTKTIDLDARFIAASNRPLLELVTDGKFREDLYYRLNVVPIELPALRDRKADISLLISHFENLFCKQFEKNVRMSKSAFNCLCDYSWPGNVRELENLVERLIVTAQTPIIDYADLPKNIIDDAVRASEAVTVNALTTLNEAIEAVERQLIEMAISKYGSGNRAAEALGVNQSTISRKARQYGLI